MHFSASTFRFQKPFGVNTVQFWYAIGIFLLRTATANCFVMFNEFISETQF
jgi:hypothetical protein